jgi:hypothetical protein
MGRSQTTKGGHMGDEKFESMYTKALGERIAELVGQLEGEEDPEKKKEIEETLDMLTDELRHRR